MIERAFANIHTGTKLRDLLPRGAGLFVLVALIVFSAVPGYQAPDGHNFVAYYLLTSAGLCLLPVAFAVKLFGLVCGASACWLNFMIANVTPRELADIYYRLYVSANCDYQFVLIFIAFYAMVKILRPSFTAWLDFLCWVGLFECLRISVQRLGWDPVYVPVNQAVSITVAAGSQGNWGWTGALLAFCAPGFFRPGRWWGLLPLAGALYLQQSLTPWAAFVGAGLVFFLFRSKIGARRGLVATTIAFLLVGLYWAYDPGDSLRFANWARGWDLSYGPRESWFLGYGLGSWIFLFPAPGTSFHRAHNEYLQLFFELGFMGILATLLYGRFVVCRLLRTRGAERASAASGMAAVALASFGNFPFHLAGTAVIAVGWMALFDLATGERNGRL